MTEYKSGICEMLIFKAYFGHPDKAEMEHKCLSPFSSDDPTKHQLRI